MKTQSCLLAAFLALAACDAKNDQGAMNAKPITTGAGSDGAAESATGQNAGAGAAGAEANDCCAGEGSPAGKDAESPKDAEYEPEVDAGCSCSQEPGNVYRMALACFCKGSCREYDPANPGGQFCGPPGQSLGNRRVHLTNYSSCSLIGIELFVNDGAPLTYFFDANTNKLVGVSEGSSFFQAYDTRCPDAGAMHYTVVYGVLPTCAGTFVRDLCAKQDASAGGD